MDDRAIVERSRERDDHLTDGTTLAQPAAAHHAGGWRAIAVVVSAIAGLSLTPGIGAEILLALPVVVGYLVYSLIDLWRDRQSAPTRNWAVLIGGATFLISGATFLPALAVARFPFESASLLMDIAAPPLVVSPLAMVLFLMAEGKRNDKATRVAVVIVVTAVVAFGILSVALMNGPPL